MADPPDRPPTVEFGRFTLIRHRRALLVDGRPVELGGRAFDVLVTLVDAGGSVLEKDAMLSQVWPDRVVEENNLQAQVSALRKALGPDRGLIRTVPGRGYQFTGEIRVAAAPASGAATPPTDLPAHLSELIGRDAALDLVADLVSRHRLVTLTGPGGVGKTRLSLEVARRLLRRFAGGVWLVELGRLGDPELVPAAVAATLGLPLGSDAVTPDRVAAAVGLKQILLVLDNCEHVIQAAAHVAEAVLAASPRAHVLATSREALRATAEQVYQVPPLDVPADDIADVEDVLRHGAVRLFTARAQAADPGYVLTPRHAAAAAAVCRRLDGMPLALELAAARAAAFGIEGVAARLDDRFRLLTGGNRTALPRHQTLRATLDWSHELLSNSDRSVLRRLAIFAGAFSLESATAVVAGAPMPAVQVPESIANLVAKSLLSVDLGRHPVHYRLLETTRVYARERLAESDELDEVARRHAEHHRDLLERASGDWETLPGAGWLAAYAHALDDVRAALDWAFSPRGDRALGVALTLAVVPLWTRLSLVEEWRERVERALSNLADIPGHEPRDQMRLSAAHAQSLLLTKGPTTEGEAAWSRALDLAERVGDTDHQFRALWGLFVHRFTIADYRAGLAIAERFSRLAERVADPAYERVGDRLLGNALHVLGDQPRARTHLELMYEHHLTRPHRSHSIRFLWDQRVVAHAFYARVLWLQGLPDRALAIAARIVADAQSADHPTSLFYALVETACPVTLLAGDLAAAEDFVGLLGDLAARHARTVWSSWHECLGGMLALARGDAASAAQQLRRGLDGAPGVVFHFHRTVFLAELGEALGRSGALAQGMAFLDDALEWVRRHEEGWCLAELLRRKGELCLLDEAMAPATPEDLFRQAIDVARSQGALSWELRSATSLARLHHRQGRSRAGRKVLAPVYRRLTEGFKTADALAARALLETLR